MEPEYINLTEENLSTEHLSCIIRSRKPHPGVECKRQWLADRLKEGHVFRKLQVKGPVFMEYAPLETAWVPVEGANYLYIYCLWVDSAWKGHGYGRDLMTYCIEDARRQGKSGVCMLGADKQKAWLSDQSFARKFGFETVDRTDTGYTLLALSLDGSLPRFTDNARRGTMDDKELTIYYDHQCPFVDQTVKLLRDYCQEKGFPLTLREVDTLEKAKALPCPFNNWAVFWQGKFQTVNLPGTDYVDRLQKKADGGWVHGTD
ncbi:MAG: GNAT family N-acetyltransferase [Aristaeellaceae bacterium]